MRRKIDQPVPDLFASEVYCANIQDANVDLRFIDLFAGMGGISIGV